jgi:phosphohistidine phosphatase
VPDVIGSAIVIGHNPALQDLALDLARPGPARRVAEEKAAGALIELELHVDNWAALGRGDAELLTFVCPRDLPP